MVSPKLFFRLLPWILVAILAIVVALSQWSLFNGFSREGTTYIERTTMLERVEQLGKIELVKYRFQEIIEWEEEASYHALWDVLNTADGARVVLIAAGEAVGCVDLTKLKPNAFDTTRTDTLLVRLPEPELCYYKIDMERSRIYEAEKGRLASSNLKAALVDSAYKKAERGIRKAAEEAGILEETKANAQLVLRPIFQQLSQRHVVFVFPQTLGGTFRKPE